MGLFNLNNGTVPCEHVKKLESFKNENQALKKQLSSAVVVTHDYTESAKKLKEMLAVVEVLRQLEDETLVLDVTDSEKFNGGISVGVMDAKTKKSVLAIYAEGKDKKEKSRFGGISYYEYVPHKAVLFFPKDSTQIKIPAFLVEYFGYHLTDHVTKWSGEKDKQETAKLDTVLQKLGA